MEHTNIPAGEIHSPYQWIAATEAARLALVPEEGDLNKLCLQEDTRAEWRLTAIAPAAWELAATWEGVAAKPATFPPAAHNHDAAYEPKDPGIQAHLVDEDNPHGVTKDQIGLGNVDNTSDADKPVSIAVQTALNSKANSSHTHTAASISDFGEAVDARVAAALAASSSGSSGYADHFLLMGS